jgi:hypothetical protein
MQGGGREGGNEVLLERGKIKTTLFAQSSVGGGCFSTNPAAGSSWAVGLRGRQAGKSEV